MSYIFISFDLDLIKLNFSKDELYSFSNFFNDVLSILEDHKVFHK